MNKVISEFGVGKYKVLILDEKQSDALYNKYQIDGKEYEPVSVYDVSNCIAIESSDIFEGKVVKFIN